MSEAFQFLNSVLRETASKAAMTAAYPSWSDDFSRKEIESVWANKGNGLREPRSKSITAGDFWSMSAAEMDMLGFGTWDDSGLRLIPLWAWSYIADREELTCIDGTMKVKGVDDIDLDVRFGCIAHGFLPKALGK